MQSNETINTSQSKSQQKELIKPYRKYQLLILFLLLIFLFLIIKLISFNQSLNYKLKQTNSLDTQLGDLAFISTLLANCSENLKANLLIYGIDNKTNLDIIHTYTELAMINDWVDGKDSDVQYMLCYKATRDGDKAASFMDKCGHASPLLVLIETTDGYRFGGFTKQSYEKTFAYITDPEAFLFSFDTKKKYNIVVPEKALNDRGLPSFGASDVSLRDGFLSNTASMSKFPDTYERDEEATGDYILTGGVRHFQVKEVEVFYVFIRYSKL